MKSGINTEIFNPYILHAAVEVQYVSDVIQINVDIYNSCVCVFSAVYSSADCLRTLCVAEGNTLVACWPTLDAAKMTNSHVLLNLSPNGLE